MSLGRAALLLVALSAGCAAPVGERQTVEDPADEVLEYFWPSGDPSEDAAPPVTSEPLESSIELGDIRLSLDPSTVQLTGDPTCGGYSLPRDRMTFVVVLRIENLSQTHEAGLPTIYPFIAGPDLIPTDAADPKPYQAVEIEEWDHSANDCSPNMLRLTPHSYLDMHGYPPVSVPMDAEPGDYSLILCIPTGGVVSNQRQVAWTLDGRNAVGTPKVCPRIHRQPFGQEGDGVWTSKHRADPLDEY